jgi:hypothetical protein
MAETQAMAQFVEENASNIGDARAFRTELQRPAIRIEEGRPIKKGIRFHDLRIDAREEGHRDRVLPERLAEDVI